MSFSNEYTLNVDIKKRMSNVVPIFRQGDTAILKFRVYDNGVRYNMRDYTRSEITFELPSGHTMVNECTLVNDMIVYEFQGVEMEEVGNVSVLVSVYSGTTVVSVQPFKIHIYDNMRGQDLSYIKILQDLTKETQALKVELIPMIAEVIGLKEEINELSGYLEEREIERFENELDRVDNENNRIQRENARIQANNTYQQNETTRTQQETARVNKETQRTTAENARVTAESTRASNESTRIVNNNLAIDRLNTAVNSFDFKGQYSTTVNYVRYNTVQHNGESYVALKNVRNITPTDDGVNWQLIARRGIDGLGTVSSVNGILPNAQGELKIPIVISSEEQPDNQTENGLWFDVSDAAFDSIDIENAVVSSVTPSDTSKLWMQENTEGKITLKKFVGGTWKTLNPKTDVSQIVDSVSGKNQSQINTDITQQLAQIEAIAPINKNRVSPAANIVLSADTFELAWMTDKDVCYYIGGTSVLSKSTNYGATKTELRTFTQGISFVRELTDGSLLVGERQSGTLKGKVWRSNNAQSTWTQVLELSPNSFIPSPWGADVHDGLIFLSEYGTQGSAQKVYKSTDYGITFTQILNIGDYAPLPSQAHIHGVTWDKYYNRIWITWGDGTRILNDNMGVLYSDDMGVTWHKVNVPYQLLNAWAFEERVIFVSDATPNGIYSYERVSKDVPPKIELIYPFDNKDYLTYLSSFMYRKSQQHPLIISCNIEPHSAETAPTKFALATFDGKNFTELWRDTKVHESGQSNFTMIAPTIDNKIIGSMTKDGRNTITKIVADYAVQINATPQNKRDDVVLDVSTMGVLGNGFDETRGLYNAILYAAQNNKTLLIPQHMTISVKQLTISNLTKVRIQCLGTIKLVKMSHGDIGNALKFVNCGEVVIDEAHFDGNIAAHGDGTTKVQPLHYLLHAENCDVVRFGTITAQEVGGRVVTLSDCDFVEGKEIIANSNDTGIITLRVENCQKVTVDKLRSIGVGDVLSYDVQIINIRSVAGKTCGNIEIKDAHIETVGRNMIIVTSADVNSTSGVKIHLNGKLKENFNHNDVNAHTITLEKSNLIKLTGSLKGASTRKGRAALLATLDGLQLDLDTSNFNQGYIVGRDAEVKNTKISGKIHQISTNALLIGRVTNVDFKELEITNCVLETSTTKADILNVTPSIWTNVKFDRCKFTKGNATLHDTCVSFYGVTLSNVVFDNCDFTGFANASLSPFWGDRVGMLRHNCRGFNNRLTVPTSTTRSSSGEVFTNDAPAAGGYLGWVCIGATNDASTFKGYGLIQA